MNVGPLSMTVGPWILQRPLERQCPWRSPAQPLTKRRKPKPHCTCTTALEPPPSVPRGLASSVFSNLHRAAPLVSRELVSSHRTRFVGNPSAGSPPRRRPRKWRIPSPGCRTTSSSHGTTRSRASMTPPSSSSTAPSPRSTSELHIVP